MIKRHAPILLCLLLLRLAPAADVTIIDDAIDEPDQSFTLGLQSVVNAQYAGETVSVTIQDNDPAPTLRLTATSLDVPEDMPSTQTLTIQMEDGAGNPTHSEKTVSGEIRVTAGTATEGADYTVESVPFTIAPGADHAVIQLHGEN